MVINKKQQSTNILSDDSPLLRRALNQQTGDFDGTSTLAMHREVLLLIRGMVERIDMDAVGTYKLGRFGFSSPNMTQVDLSAYGAGDRGVSRQHASLHLEDDHLWITDLGSTNGTYVRGKRLEPNTPTALRRGDEVLLGRLAVQIVFR